MKYIRYRFMTSSEDHRPVIDFETINMPWWCTGYSGSNMYAIIVCYLPKHEDLLKYWPEAEEIETEEVDKITYTDRFPKPDWIKDDLKPCPFCGEVPKLWWESSPFSEEYCYIQCNCGLSAMYEYRKKGDTEPLDQEKRAIARWNTRKSGEQE